MLRAGTLLLILIAACGDDDARTEAPLIPDGSGGGDVGGGDVDAGGEGGGAPDGSGGGGGGGGGGGAPDAAGGGGGGGTGDRCDGVVASNEGDEQEEVVPAACVGKGVDSWSPMHGPRGGILGGGGCGSSAPCPTTYVEGNVGAPCSSDAQCSGFNALCLTVAEAGGGTCSARGCEIGSNFGCPRGDTCVAMRGDTYCLEGCGVDESGCFVHCDRAGFSCFNTESKFLGYCLYASAVAQCNPQESVTCARPEFGDGVCDRTSWDDFTVGKCFESCNPIAQDCSNPAAGCYAVRDVEMPVCYENWGRAPGDPCTRLTHCGKGMTCQCPYDDASLCAGNTNMICARYCMPDCDGHCAAGETCRKILGWPYGACIPQ